MTRDKTATAVVIAIILVGAAFWATYVRPIVFCAFLQEDDVDRVFCGTHDRLANYEEQPEKTIEWVLANHGALPSTMVMLQLMNWGMEQQDSFIDLLSRLDHEDVDLLIDQLAFTNQQGGLIDPFVEAFSARKDESNRVRMLLERMEALRR